MTFPNSKSWVEFLIFITILYACDNSKNDSSGGGPAAGSANASGDFIFQGQLSIDQLDSSVAGDELRLKNREVSITDDTEKTIAKTLTGNDGSYVITVPASLAIDPNASTMGTSLNLATSHLSIEAIIGDTSDQSVIGFKNPLNMENGKFQALGKNELSKITAIRGQILLEGAKDSSGIVVYIPGTSLDARTDVRGNFLMTFLAAGAYDLKMEKDGYISNTLTSITVIDSETTKIDLQTLKLSGGTSQFSVKQVGKEGYSGSRIVDFIIDSGNADRFKAGLIDDVDVEPYGPVAQSFRFEFSEDGDYTLKFMFANSDGFESTALRRIIVDTVAPLSSQVYLADRSSLSITHTNELNVTIFHSTCFDIDRVAVIAASEDHVPNEDEYIYPCRTFADDSNANFRLPLGTNTFSYKLWVMDKSGNKSVSASSSSIMYDNIAPLPPVGIIKDQTSSSVDGTDITTVNIGFSNCNGIDKVIFSESQTTPPPASAFSQACEVSQNAYNYTFYTNQEGSKTLYFWSMDYAGNISETASNTSIILDQTPPTAPTFTLADPTSGVVGFTNDAMASASIAHCNDAVQVLISDQQSSKPTEASSGWQNCATTGVTANLTQQGSVTVYLWAKDIGGNISASATTTAIIVDTEPPVASSYSLSLADSSSGSSTHTNALTIGYTFSDCSSENVEFYLSESNTAPVESDFTLSCSSGAGYATGNFVLTSGVNETKHVYAWVKDTAGNISVSYLTATIILDTLDPDLPGTFALLDSDTSSTSYTNSTTMNFSVDNCPAGDFLLMREGQVSAPTEDDAAWLSCANSGSVSSVVSSGNGLKTVYLWKKDAAGNILGSLTTETTWDGDAPAPPVVSTPSAYTTYTQNNSITVSGTAEANSTVVISGGSSVVNVSVDGYGNFSSSVNLNQNSYHSLSIGAKDAAGNTGALEYKSIYQDTIAPTVSNVQILLTSSSAKITWSSNEPGDTHLEWGTSLAYGNTVVVDSIYGADYFGYSHSVTISSLSEYTLYYFKIVVTDQAGNTDTDNDYADTLKTYIDKSGSINSETWNITDSSYYISNNLTLVSGETLQIDPGVSVRLAAGKRIVIEGELNARGTQPSPITISPNAINPSTADYWDAIVFETSSVSPVMVGDSWSDGNVLEYVNIDRGGSNATYSNSLIYVKTGVAVLNCDLSHADYANWATFITAYGSASVYLIGSSFSSYHSYVTYGALHVSSTGNGGTFTIKNNDFTASGSSGMKVHLWVDASPATLSITNNQFNGCTGLNSSNTRSSILFGSGVNPGSMSVINNVFKSGNSYCGGINISGNASIENNIFWGNGYMPGITYSPGGSSRTLSVQKNIFVNNKPAISALYWSAASSITYNINSNQFLENNAVNRLPTSGTYGDGPSSIFNIAKASAGYTIGAYAANFVDNLFYKNLGAAATQSLVNMFQDGANAPTYTFTNNNFIGNTASYYLYNLALSPATAVNAQSNWWDSTDTNIMASKLYDSVDDNTYSTIDFNNYLGQASTTAPLSPPSSLSVVNNGGGSVTLSWIGPSESDVSGYRVYYNTSSGFPYIGTGADQGVSGIDVGNQTSYALTGLTTNQTYYFTITAYDASADDVSDQFDGNESWYSNEYSIYVSP